MPKPSANALYTLSIGANDLNDILCHIRPDRAAADRRCERSVANEITFVKGLIADGAKNLLVLDVPDLGKTPTSWTGRVNGSNTPSAALEAEASQLASSYNSALTSQLTALATADAVDCACG